MHAHSAREESERKRKREREVWFVAGASFSTARRKSWLRNRERRERVYVSDAARSICIIKVFREGHDLQLAYTHSALS